MCKVENKQNLRIYEKVILKNSHLTTSIKNCRCYINIDFQKRISEATEAMIVEDLAAIDEISEEKIMHVLQERFNRGLFYTYIGDILLFLNPNCSTEIYDNKV